MTPESWCFSFEFSPKMLPLIWSSPWHRRALLQCMINHVYQCDEGAVRPPMETGSLRWGGRGSSFQQRQVGRQGGVGMWPSCNHLPTRACLAGDQPYRVRCVILGWEWQILYFLSLFSFLSPTPSGNDKEGEVRPSGAVGRSGREKVFDSDSTWKARLHLVVSKDWLKQHRQGPFMEVSILLQECAFGNFDSSLHFQGFVGVLSEVKVFLCAPPFLTQTLDAILPISGKLSTSWSSAKTSWFLHIFLFETYLSPLNLC